MYLLDPWKRRESHMVLLESELAEGTSLRTSIMDGRLGPVVTG